MKTRNPYAVDNVNVAQGPRTGNETSHAGKRGDFLDSKAEREPIAAEIERAYASRQDRDYRDKNWAGEGAVDEDVKPRRFKRDAGSQQPHRARK